MESIEKRYLENLLCDYFGSDPSYYPKEEVDTINRLINLTYNFAQKEIRQKLLDKLNAYKSRLKELKTEKLSKTINQDKVKELEIRIDTIKQLMK